MTIDDYVDALKVSIAEHSTNNFAFADFDSGFTSGCEHALDLLIDVIKTEERTGPSKERLLALADKMLVLGSPQSSKELLDIAERFGV
ncbi:hypothetical protein UFOVP150_78 [uncultured Caudovirales phage]|uniref:Uncharacterized protein n=1 Tax=uncultured Caudovirales phage TaxID=2100421 RepID=A0A6J7WCQ1_9CAUD|nr:hypothetical protein UFOVP150_78 [uncultured Caudovirales phage]